MHFNFIDVLLLYYIQQKNIINIKEHVFIYNKFYEPKLCFRESILINSTKNLHISHY
jgi:hypothetical protein